MVGDIISDLMTTSWETRAAVGEPASTIRVNDLSFTISGPHDAWGRPSRPQPVSVSVEMAFSELFSASSSGDVVGADTVHYGKLSKEIQKIMGTVDGQSLTGVFNELWMGLGAWDILERKGPGGEPKGSAEGSAAYVQFAIYLPKASLLGSGVSMAGSAATSSHNGVPILRRKAVTLRFHDLRVPTLIGVNDNEREAEQMVVANVEVDRWLEREDGYSLLERVITKTIRESSFETLEALATHLSVKINEYLWSKYTPPHEKGWRLRISLEKPIAVPLADAPCVQLNVDTRDIRASIAT